LDISEKRISQDGRFLVRVGEERFDVRVSTLPTQNGEKVVMRLLDPRTACVPFERLGFSSQGSKKFQQLIRQPQGMVLVTGPTGSGKSTTLYSAVNSIRSSSINITTIEDPIEYVIEGLNQVQVNKRSGRTFASCLRSILRQDPNVVLVGEIRDAETAEIALTSAQTGHLLLSTLHTNDSLSAVSRLADLGIPAFLIASSLSAVLAQRLVRKLCENCSSPEPLDKDQASLLQSLDLRHMPKLLFAAKGCEKCDGEGYRGRVGIYELLVVDEVLAEAIRSGAQEEVLRDLAIASGMVPLMDDALAKVIKGMTTLEEVVRVVPQSKRKNVACGNCDQLLSPAFRFCPQCATPIGSCVRRNVDLLSPLAGVLNSFDPSTRPI
jgi:type II secretory ATPase GspE/PulE/Tfp pilus assembly ATPase PilB-like protein